MKNRDRKSADWKRWGHNDTHGARVSSGYRKKCEYCGVGIYLKRDGDDTWRPYESWVTGNVSEGEWVYHHCEA